MSNVDPKAEFWKSFLRAVETEPREAARIQGKSGFSHPAVAVGVDESRRRLVLVSGEPDARSAALAQADIQAAMPDVHVLMTRPAAINLSDAARVINEFSGRLSFGHDDFEKFTQDQEAVSEVMKSFFEEHGDRLKSVVTSPYAAATLNLLATFQEVLQQLSFVEIEFQDSDDGVRLPTIDLKNLAAIDPAELDRQNGVCSFPIYEFSEVNLETLQSGADIEAVRAILKEREIFQYFFPAADQLALGLIDTSSRSVSRVVSDLEQAPALGHPFGSLELVDSSLNLTDAVLSLQERGFLVEGELGLDVGPDGREVRAKVMFRPREGLIEKISRIVSIKMDVSLKDLFK